MFAPREDKRKAPTPLPALNANDPAADKGLAADAAAAPGMEAASAAAVREAAAEHGSSSVPTPGALAQVLGRVQFRHDPAADRSTRLLGAAAVAFGDRILFRRGRHDPHTPSGRALIAHELTHVLQQSQLGKATPQRLVVGDVLSVQYTRTMAEQMTDAELSQQIELLRAHLTTSPGDAGAAQNLAVLEAVARDRIPARTPAPAGPAAPAEPAEQHGSLWWALHRAGLTITKHERAEQLRWAWGPRGGVTVIENGEEVDVDLLSDDEVIELNRRLRGRPIGPPVAAAAGVLSAAQGGQIIGWGTSNSAEAVSQTEAVTRSLTPDSVRAMASRGLTRDWVVQNLAKYERAAAAGGDKLRNVQLLPRLRLMRRLLELWPP